MSMYSNYVAKKRITVWSYKILLMEFNVMKLEHDDGTIL